VDVESKNQRDSLMNLKKIKAKERLDEYILFVLLDYSLVVLCYCSFTFQLRVKEGLQALLQTPTACKRGL
jgi:hypothetical protein